MAGPTREEERHFKKQTDRRDFNAKRKNSFGKKQELQMSNPPNPTVAITTSSSSPSTPSIGITSTTTSSTTASTLASGPALPSLRPTQEHIPLNSFNAQEVTTYLNNTWKEVLERHYDSNLSEAEKPELYSPPVNKPAWGQRGNRFLKEFTFRIII
ncbi:1933_t:CDS:2 [Ambispora gerdemannii]|uniref:1933_t:CDS:1 n=1 Tax=Ambispora gerdemannii TaxID=144530 RepID=A0A9N8ZMS6_9GLOM|nr:1933_t:CDS:2 [Ambispora gerdemannii]